MFVLGMVGSNQTDLIILPNKVYAQARDPLPEISLTRVAEGLARPVNISHAGDGSSRPFII